MTFLSETEKSIKASNHPPLSSFPQFTTIHPQFTQDGFRLR